jgi:hypothetical protein
MQANNEIRTFKNNKNARQLSLVEIWHIDRAAILVVLTGWEVETTTRIASPTKRTLRLHVETIGSIKQWKLVVMHPIKQHLRLNLRKCNRLGNWCWILRQFEFEANV